MTLYRMTVHEAGERVDAPAKGEISVLSLDGVWRFKSVEATDRYCTRHRAGIFKEGETDACWMSGAAGESCIMVDVARIPKEDD